MAASCTSHGLPLRLLADIEWLHVWRSAAGSVSEWFGDAAESSYSDVLPRYDFGHVTRAGPPTPSAGDAFRQMRRRVLYRWCGVQWCVTTSLFLSVCVWLALHRLESVEWPRDWRRRAGPRAGLLVRFWCRRTIAAAETAAITMSGHLTPARIRL